MKRFYFYVNLQAVSSCAEKTDTDTGTYSYICNKQLIYSSVCVWHNPETGYKKISLACSSCSKNGARTKNIKNKDSTENYWERRKKWEETVRSICFFRAPLSERPGRHSSWNTLSLRYRWQFATMIHEPYPWGRLPGHKGSSQNILILLLSGFHRSTRGKRFAAKKSDPLPLNMLATSRYLQSCLFLAL